MRSRKSDRRSGRLLVALAAVLALILTACGSDDPPPTAAPTTEAESRSRSGQRVPADTLPAVPVLHTTVTPLEAGPVDIKAEPSDDAETIHVLDHPRLIDGDPNAAVPLVLLIRQQAGEWIEVDLPVRPNGSTGWVRAADMATETHPYRIEVHLDEFTLRVFDGRDVVFETAIATAADNTPTPGGRYYTTELIAPPDPFGPYGTYAYGLSGYSDVLTSFNGGPGQLGIHGTNQPQLIGQSVSAGCIRMTNEDIEYLAEDLGLPLGVPVDVISSGPDDTAA